MRERLIEILSKPIYPKIGVDPAEVVADYLLDNGVIVPPCKVGDILFVLSRMKDKRVLPFINEYEATSIEMGKRKCVVYHQLDGFIKIFKQDDFGKTVFLTREEAEKALEERSRHDK